MRIINKISIPGRLRPELLMPPLVMLTSRATVMPRKERVGRACQVAAGEEEGQKCEGKSHNYGCRDYDG